MTRPSVGNTLIYAALRLCGKNGVLIVGKLFPFSLISDLGEGRCYFLEHFQERNRVDFRFRSLV